MKNQPDISTKRENANPEQKEDAGTIPETRVNHPRFLFSILTGTPSGGRLHPESTEIHSIPIPPFVLEMTTPTQRLADTRPYNTGRLEKEETA